MKTFREVLEEFRLKEWLCMNDITDGDEHINRRLDEALTALAGVVDNMKMKEHGDFCCTRSEWRDNEIDECDCGMQAVNRTTEEIASKIREGVKS